MSNALAALRQGDLEKCLSELKNEIRKNPSDPEKRVFLFQLFAVLGDWEKSLTQLNVARDLDKQNQSMAETYQEVLRCEGLRAAVFKGEKTPMILGEPPGWTALLVQSLQHFAAENFDAFVQLQGDAFEQAPETPGRIYPLPISENEEPSEESFNWLADGDMRLGPVLEAVVNGRYYWIPFENIQSIEFEKPVDLRDLVWTPATFCWKNQGQAVGFIPTRYPASSQSTDDAVRMARKTMWESPSEELYVGLGQRIFTTDENEYPITSLRRIGFDADSETE